ncbi:MULTISPECIES: ThiF family adenylyltransferase [unclassified Lentimicrobium]|uniref:tRNA threonylcarbamoyladenosine dehydratase n=1 Tax=unclassified Lentimicrobium TaxID=2677434 RepID=UPI001C131405|nr:MULTISPECIES: tRNA threonylcarbamoyladenosine dehydratase [unclassified Lentimicrobium]
MSDWQERTALLLGAEKIKKLHDSHVLIVGLGGVGAYAAEQIVRAGVGQVTIVDGDAVSESNRNRQMAALVSTLDQSKAKIMEQRLLDINPDLKITTINEYIKDERMEELLDHPYDYVVDAIDTLSPKIFLLYHCLQKELKVASSMGAGGKVDPSQVQIADISKSYNDKLARILRKRLHRLGVYEGIKVVFSPEVVDESAVILTEGEQNKKTTVGTISYMPAIFGNFLSSIVIRDLMNSK